MPGSFDANAATLSVNNAAYFLKACSVAYSDNNTAAGWAKSAGFTGQFTPFSTCAPRRVGQHCDTQGFIAESPNALLIAFRGTEIHQPVDWFTDLQAVRGPSHGVGKVHRGFYEALMSVWLDTLQNGSASLPARILAAKAVNKPVWITGHSLGGALAVLCAAESQMVLGCNVQGVYTFGQPRVADADFAKAAHTAFGGKVFRFVCDRDVVPRVPAFSMGFRHFGCEVFFDHARTRHDRNSTAESFTDAVRLASLGFGLDVGFQSLSTIIDALGSKERTLGEKARLLLAAGTANIQDHNIDSSYGILFDPK